MSSSRFFQSFDPGHPQNAQFVHYARQLAGIKPAQVENIVAALDAFIGTTNGEQAEIARELGDSLRRPHAMAAALLRALEEFLRHFAKGTDDAEAGLIAADLREAGIIQLEDCDTTAALMSRLAEIASAARVKIETADAMVGYIPVCMSSGVTIELRAVYTSDDSVEPAGHVPLASVWVELDSTDNVFFQIDRVRLASFITKLQLAAQRLERIDAKGLSTGWSTIAASA